MTENDIPRRIMLPLNTTSELAIHNAVQEIESMGADVRLTNAIIHLQKAKELVSDYVDEKCGDRQMHFPPQIDMFDQIFYRTADVEQKYPDITSIRYYRESQARLHSEQVISVENFEVILKQWLVTPKSEDHGA